jgi:pyruvate dehydrogenase (quinone)
MQMVSDFLVQRLREWGVRRIYGYPGDGINGILGALGRAGNDPEFIQVRHEETAALMATGYAKLTGDVGVCLATQGPGAIHLLNGLYDARLDHQPVVAIVGQVTRGAGGGRHQQEVDLPTLFKDVAGSFVGVAADPAQMRHLVDRAMRIAIAERTVTCLIVPHDLQSQPAEPNPPHTRGMQHSALGYSDPIVIPTDRDLDRAAEVLNAAQRPAIIAGAGALGASEEVAAVARRLGAGVAKALLGKAVLPDDLPFVTGSVGWLGTAASNDMMKECDTLLMVGTGFPYTEFLPEPGQARGVQIDLNPGVLALRYPMEVALTGDSAATLSALLPRLRERERSDWIGHVERNIRQWWEDATQRAETPASPMNPRRFFYELSRQLPDRTILTADSGTGTVWCAREVKLREGMSFAVSGTLATMGCSLPYAFAARFAHPDRPVVAVVGDGAMQMSGMTELISISKYREMWSDQPFVIVVLNNRDLSYVTWEQRAMDGEPRFVPSQAIPDVPYANYARLLGLDGARIESESEIAGALESAFAANRPVVLDVVVDPNTPTLPPTPERQVLDNLAKALAEEPDAAALNAAVAADIR